MLIITCIGRNREAKVVRELVTKGFCSTKNQYYFGLKLHALAFRRKGTIPFPGSITFTPTEDNNLTVFKQSWGDTISGRTIFGDKIYSDCEYFYNQKSKIKMLKCSLLLKGSKDNPIKKNDETRLLMIYFQQLFPRSDNP